MCSGYVQSVVNDKWFQANNVAQKISETVVCDCVESHIKKDKILKLLYVEDLQKATEDMDSEKLKTHVAAKTVSYVMTCLSTSMAAVAAEVDPRK